jgi:hypothetical protein
MKKLTLTLLMISLVASLSACTKKAEDSAPAPTQEPEAAASPAAPAEGAAPAQPEGAAPAAEGGH